MRPALRMLHRKAVRDLWHLRGPVAAIGLVVACGIGSFVAMGSMVPHLANAQAHYYARARFADGWVTVKRAPRSLVPQLAAIPGIEAIEARVSGDVLLDVPGLDSPATGHLIGMRLDAPPAINQLIVRAGRLPAPGGGSEVAISEGFAFANQLRLGDQLDAIMNGRWHALRIVGIVLTPEYVLEMRPGELFPDRRRYGVLWAEQSIVESVFGFGGAWNDATFRLMAGASAPAVHQALDRLLAPYGSLGAYGRELHPSHRFLSDEIRQARTFATIIPTIFLGVTAFLLNLVLVRLVATQREQIGMLKAFGTTRGELVRHYLVIGFGPVIPGMLIGCTFGLWLAGKLARLYASYYRIPDAPFTPVAYVVIWAVGITGIAALIGTLNAVRRIAVLPAAEAMRTESPPAYRAGLVDHLPVLARLPLIGRLTLRGLERQPVRALLAMIGMALSVAIMVVGVFSFDAIRRLRDLQFTVAQREDLTVTFTAPRSPDVQQELRRLPGVLAVEPLWSVPVRLRHGERERRVALTAVPNGAALRRLVRASGAAAATPDGGVQLSAALAALLDVGLGDSVTVEILIGRRPIVRQRVIAVIDDVVGIGAFFPFEAMRTLVGDVAIDGAVLRVAAPFRRAVQDTLRARPLVAGLASRSAVLANFDQVMHDSFNVTIVTLFGFALALSLGVIYNTTRISLAERGRELASLRVLGFTRQEVARLLFGELATLGTVAIPVGFAIGLGFAWLMVRSLSSELFRLPLVVAPRTFVVSAGTLLIAGVLSALLVRRRLDRLDLIAVLKTRE